MARRCEEMYGYHVEAMGTGMGVSKVSGLLG